MELFFVNGLCFQAYYKYFETITVRYAYLVSSVCSRRRQMSNTRALQTRPVSPRRSVNFTADVTGRCPDLVVMLERWSGAAEIDESWRSSG